MEQIDLKKLKSAIIYAQRIADGNNPINNNPVENDTIINDPNVIRCMYFIKDILQKVYGKLSNERIQKKVDSQTGKYNITYLYDILMNEELPDYLRYDFGVAQ